MRGLAVDGFPASFTAGVVDRIWQADDIIVPRMRVHYTDVRILCPPSHEALSLGFRPIPLVPELELLEEYPCAEVP